MKSFIVSIPCCLLLFSIPLLAGEPNAQPNIIYIMLDDAGYGDLNVDDKAKVKTPNFARMANEGILFHHHYSGSSVCAPTRCVLMTGLHTGHCRRRDNTAKANQADFAGRPLVFLKDEDVTVAEVLKTAGYKTMGIGKWGLGNPGSTGEPQKQGFDDWYGYLDQVHAHDHYTDYLISGGKRISLPKNKNKQRGTYVHDLFEEKTLQYIRKNKSGPFFLYLAYTLPHGKYDIPADDKNLKHYENQKWSQQTKNYAAMVSRADQTVGKILDLLSELKIDENTIVFYTSDNGPNRPFVKPTSSGGGLRGIKRQLYEGGIRAKMAVRWPGKIAKKTSSNYVWDMRDVFPTACDLAGAKIPKQLKLDGISIVPTLMGKTQKPRPHMYWEMHSPFQQAVRMGKWKGIRFGTAEPVELYNLEKDPAEKNNLAKENPMVVTEIAKIMDTSRTESRYWPAKAKRRKTGNRKKNKKSKNIKQF